MGSIGVTYQGGLNSADVALQASSRATGAPWRDGRMVCTGWVPRDLAHLDRGHWTCWVVTPKPPLWLAPKAIHSYHITPKYASTWSYGQRVKDRRMHSETYQNWTLSDNKILFSISKNSHL